MTRVPTARRDAVHARPADLHPPPTVQLSIVVLNIVYAVVGVALMYGSYRLFDHLNRRIDFEDELQKGNMAVAIVIGSIFIAIAMIISGALG